MMFNLLEFELQISPKIKVYIEHSTGAAVGLAQITDPINISLLNISLAEPAAFAPEEIIEWAVKLAAYATTDRLTASDELSADGCG